MLWTELTFASAAQGDQESFFVNSSINKIQQEYKVFWKGFYTMLGLLGCYKWSDTNALFIFVYHKILVSKALKSRMASDFNRARCSSCSGTSKAIPEDTELFFLLNIYNIHIYGHRPRPGPTFFINIYIYIYHVSLYKSR